MFFSTNTLIIFTCLCVQVADSAGQGGVGSASAVRGHWRPGGSDAGRQGRGCSGATTQWRVKKTGKTISDKASMS